jgi:hypothetical protein
MLISLIHCLKQIVLDDTNKFVVLKTKHNQYDLKVY